jgi:hypothetical protein
VDIEVHTGDMLANRDRGDLHGVRRLSFMMPFEFQGAAKSASYP